MPESRPFTAEERRKLLDECFLEMMKHREIARAYDEAGDDEAGAIEPAFDASAGKVKELWRKYLDGLPSPVLSRCPFTGMPWRHSFDPYGLDGLWWNYDKPIRPFREPYGGKSICFTGAVTLNPPIERAPFRCQPGPEAPYLIPNLLADNRVKAVISQVAVGHHTGFLIVYYAMVPAKNVLRCPDWGTATASWQDPGGGAVHFEEGIDLPDQYDFHIRPWIERGRVAWIAPGDASLTLRYDAPGCPFLDLPGDQTPPTIENGEVWRPGSKTGDQPE